MDKNKKSDLYLLTGFIFLTITPFLYIFRGLDDNTLTSWRWVFTFSSVGAVYLSITVGAALSFALSGASWPQRKPLAFLFILAFAAVIPLWDEPEVILDASRYFVQAKYLQIYGPLYFLKEWGREIPVWTDMPSGAFFYGIIFRYLGESRVYIQIFNTLLFASTVSCVFLIGKHLWDEKTGFYAGALLLGIPYLLVQPPLMLVDVLTMFFCTFTILFFLMAVEKGGAGRILLCSSFIFLSVMSKYSAGLMLFCLPLIVYTAGGVDLKARITRSLYIFSSAAIMFCVFLLLNYEVFIRQMDILATYQWPGLGRWQESHLSTFLFQAHPLIAVAAAYGIYLAVKKKDRKFLIAGWFFIFIFLLEVKRIRYMIPVFPLFALAASYGLRGLKDDRLKRFTVYCIVASSLTIAYSAYLPFLRNTSGVNLQKAGEYIDRLGCETINVQVSPQRDSSGSTKVAVPILDYYIDTKIAVNKVSYPDSKKTGAPSRTSSLRFTWEYKTPKFYIRSEAAGKSPVASVSSERSGEAGAVSGENGRSAAFFKEFDVSSGVYKYKTYVTVFGKACK